MASELRVNTLKDASGNNSIATSFVAGGSGKSWISFDGNTADASTNMTGVNGSFNVSALEDDGTGDYDVLFTTNMGNTNYSITSGGTRRKHSEACVHMSFCIELDKIQFSEEDTTYTNTQHGQAIGNSPKNQSCYNIPQRF